MADLNLHDFDQPIILTDKELKKQITGHLTVFREMGLKALRTGNTEEALRKFHTAAAAYPDDVRNLLSRGKSRYQIKLLQQAQSDAEKVLNMNDYDKEAILLQARCEYELGNAEEALLMFRRGANKRGMRAEFTEGGQAVLATLENCIGRHSGSVLYNFHPTIHSMIEQQHRMAKLEAEKKKIHCLEDTKPIYNCSDEEWRRLQMKRKQRDDRIAFVYLGNLANELQFNEHLSKDMDPRIRKIAKLAYKETDDLLSILRVRRPLYHVKHKYESCQKTINQQKSKLYRNEVTRLCQNAERMLKNIQEFGETLQFKKSIDQAHSLKLLLEKMPDSAIELKTRYLNELCEIVGKIYFNMKSLHPKLSKEDNFSRVGLIMGQNQLFNQMTFNWITDLGPFPFFDCKSHIKKYKEFIDTSENDLERAWLHHELARAYIINHKWPFATSEARKSAHYARKCNHLLWEANALFLIIIGETHRKEGEALDVFHQTYSLALKIKSEVFLELLQVVGQVLKCKSDDKPHDALALNAKREEEIIRLMDGLEMKAKARDLFSRMRFLRGDRRMALLPSGLILGNHKGGTLSIIPGGPGGRLGLHAVTNRTYYEFLGVADPYK